MDAKKAQQAQLTQQMTERAEAVRALKTGKKWGIILSAICPDTADD